jgi:hypothetical protein
MKNKILLLLPLPILALLLGCPSSGPPPTTNPISFFVHTEFFPLVGPLQTVPGVTTNWSNPRDVVGGNTPAGDTSPFSVTTNDIGLATVENKRVPAVWFVVWASGNVPGTPPGECVGDANDFPVNPQRATEVICFEIPTSGTSTTAGNAFTFSPQPLYTDGSAGNSATISGQGFRSQYGMPLVRYYDMSGTLLNQANVTSMASDGTWVTAPIPDLTQIVAGSYVGILYNANANGGYDFIGTTSVNVLDPIIPPDNGGCQGDPRPINCN